MKIAGFQKLSLLEYPDKICAIVFTQGCNFRCSYCHNPELVSIKFKTNISEESIFACLSEKKKMLDGVCITGGEPTLQADLFDFIVKIKKLGYLVKLDTNGSNPVVLKRLLDKKLLDYIAMDVKAPWARYLDITDIRKFGNCKKSKISKIDNASKIGKMNKINKVVFACQQSFQLIQNSGVDHEFRTTVFPQKHLENDFFEMAGYLKSGEKYYLQNIKYIKNLDPNLDQSVKINVSLLLKKLRFKFSDLIIEER